MNTAAIIVAAGKGTRMGNLDKLFVEVAGRPLVSHTWARFDGCEVVGEIVLVIRAEQESLFRKLASQFKPRKPFKFANGGKERQDSVWSGLEALSPNVELVAIQDGARPCTSDNLIKSTFTAAREHGAAVAAQRVTDTVKESADGERITRHLDRSRLWAVQTPQIFRVHVIRRALMAVREKQIIVTDDTAACELIGQPVKLVESAEPNPKLTFAEDAVIIERLLKAL
ncbi:MAG TPA: 2-C-methyl-D-erythritol 4-phosphate cytidylyltransferase [Candidatus Binatia bacterium]|nr:2-C-methyl-D-erythritol 4-phosphate cytidylyltransferase [Candidatus Binatia bacterium]